MFKTIRKLLYVLTVFLMAVPLVSCSGGGSDAVGSSGGSGTVGTTGFLDISLTDVPGDYLNVFITIEEVWVDNGTFETENWALLDLPNLPQTFDLISLQNGVIAPLGAVELEAGHYNQMRLLLSDAPFANYLVIEGEQGEPPVEVELKTPSSYVDQSGYKIVKGFDIEVAGSTELILDFNAEKSIVQAGKSGQWLLKPTVKVLETVKYSVSGVVEDDAAVRLNGASISTQIYDDSQADPMDEITVLSGTESAPVDVLDDGVIVNGYYFMYLPITRDTFNIVATEEGFLPDCQVFTADTNTDGTKIVDNYTGFNFTLTATATGTLIGSMTGLDVSADSAHFSIRQSHGTCGMIEVASASVVKTVAPADVEYFLPITLPVGIYEVVVSADDEVTQVWNIEVADGAETVLDTYFPTTSVEGTVNDGAVISVQDYDSLALDLKDAIVEIFTIDSAGGAYFTYLPTDQSSYNVVAMLDGYTPQCQEAITGVANIFNFALTAPTETGIISGSVTGMAAAESAIVSIRQASCGMIEVASVSVLNDGTFGPMTFPVGTYEVVVSADGYDTQVSSAGVSNGVDTSVPVVLIATTP